MIHEPGRACFNINLDAQSTNREYFTFSGFPSLIGIRMPYFPLDVASVNVLT